MKLIDDISLQLDIFAENGRYKIFIAEENSTGITLNIKNIKDISKAVENYLTEVL